MIIRLLELFIYFFVIGLFTIGGGYAMIPMISDVVIGKGWLTGEQLLNFIAIAESTPGPFAVNTATLVGFYHIPEAPLLGAVVTTIAVTLPSFIIILIIAAFLQDFFQKKGVRWALGGIKATVVGLIAAVVVSLINSNIVVDNKLDIYAVIILVIVFALKFIFKKKLGPIPLILISGFLGFIFYFIL